MLNQKSEIAKLEPFRAEIALLKEQNERLSFDITTAEGEKAARSWIYKLRQMKAPINEAHKVSKEEALRFCQALDNLKRELIGEIDAMIDVHYAPIKAREDRIKAEKEAEEQRKREEEEARLREIEEREKAIKEREAEIARKEREEQIRIEAEARAKREAEEMAERKIKEAEAEAARKIQAEKDRIEKEKRDAEAREKARIENEEHRAKIQSEISAALVSLRLASKEQAMEIIAAIDSGKIKNLKIQY